MNPEMRDLSYEVIGEGELYADPDKVGTA